MLNHLPTLLSYLTFPLLTFLKVDLPGHAARDPGVDRWDSETEERCQGKHTPVCVPVRPGLDIMIDPDLM